MQGISLKLQGQFKFDLYSPSGELLKSSEYIDNFITNSGVLYPYHFAFADCFRFLTVGTGTSANSITSISSFPTTGLDNPLIPYTYMGSRSVWESGKDYSFYAQPGNFGAGCGSVNTDSGVSLVRQWNLPDNTGGVFTGAFTINEFMVSPGRPYVTGIGGTKFCACDEFDSTATGLDCSSTPEYYRWLSNKYLTINRSSRMGMCDATKAFARVVYPFSVQANSLLTITYKLNVTFDTGINFTSLFFSRADSNPNWKNSLNSYSSITQPGIMLINDGTVLSSFAPNNQQRLQHFNYSGTRQFNLENEYGEAFVPPLGAPLEPSNFFLINDPNNQNIRAYMSDDNTQFLVNKFGGAFTNTGTHAPWNLWTTGTPFVTFSMGNVVSSGNTSYQYINVNPASGTSLTDTTYWQNLGFLKVIKNFHSGVMSFRNENDVSLISGSNYWSARPNAFNIRGTSGTAPSASDVTTNVAMDANFFPATKTALPSLVFAVPSSGTRNASVVYSYSFENYPNSTPLQCRSFVASYKDLAYANAFGGIGDTIDLVPFFDAVLSGVGGGDGAFIPTIETGNSIVNGGTGAILNNVNDPNYNTLASDTASIYPIINTILSWNVPCPNGVIGC